jgi:hypothetical protein
VSADDQRLPSFRDAATAVLIAASRGSVFPPEVLLASWRQFVESCEQGYADNWFEFSNDRWVRRAIEILLCDVGLSAYPEWDEWAQAVADLDARYRAILIPLPGEPGPWWESSVPRIAGRDLAEDVLLYYGVHLEVP